MDFSEPFRAPLSGSHATGWVAFSHLPFCHLSCITNKKCPVMSNFIRARKNRRKVSPPVSFGFPVILKDNQKMLTQAPLSLQISRCASIAACLSIRSCIVYSLLCDFKILFLKLHSDKTTFQINTSNSCTSRTHAVVENCITFVSVGFY